MPAYTTHDPVGDRGIAVKGDGDGPQPKMEWERLASRLAEGQSLELSYEALVRTPEEVPEP